MSSPSDKSAPRVVALSLLLCLLLVLLRAPLQLSLWLDELVSFWVIKDGSAAAVQRSFEFQGQSPLYFLLLQTWCQIWGSTELALRSFSVLAWLGSCWLIFQLGRSLFGFAAASAAVLFFASISAVQVAAISARPYSLALLFCVASVFFLLRYREKGGAGFLMGYALSTLLTFYAHYLYCAIVLVHAVLLYDLSKSKRLYVIAAWALIALGAFPAIAQLKNLAAKRVLYDQSAFIIAEPLWRVWLQPNVIFLLVLAALLALLFLRANLKRPHFSRRSSSLVLAWSTLPPLALYFMGLCLGAELNLPRYYLSFAPGFALLLGALFVEILGCAPHKAFMLLALMFVTAESQRCFEVEDWRGAIQSVRSVQSLSAVPVLYVPGLVEAGSEQWLNDNSKLSYLFAPFSYYPLEVSPFVLPLSTDSDLIAKWTSGPVEQTIVQAHEFILLAPRMFQDRGGIRTSVTQAYQHFFEQQGFALRTDQSGSVQALRFFKITN